MKKNRQYASPTEPGFLRGRIQEAMKENRFQHALELARQQFKYEPTPEHHELLLRAQFGRAQQLRLEGKTRDAAAILQSSLQTPNLSAEWKAKLATELAGAGDAATAIKLATSASPEAAAKVLAFAADAAVEREQAGKAMLPPEQHADFERILLAFKQQESGQDDAARETLQEIGLRSPFLEWKLLLRGLIAYYQKDDARALENWQRLSPERIPARLIAPYRAAIDSAFVTEQTAAARNQLTKQAHRLQGDGSADHLRDLQKTLTRNESLAQAFRKAEQATSMLKREAPQFLPRLARAMYCALLDQGHYEDIPRYQRIFGAPPDDPSFHRLNAVGHERCGSMEEAHRYWQLFEQEVARNPAPWPGDEAVRVRALVWQHMGQNADTSLEDQEIDEDSGFLGMPRLKPPKLKPDAETCFRKAIALAPDNLEAHLSLFRHLIESAEMPSAIEAGRTLLARFPDQVDTMAVLGGVFMTTQQYPEALSMFQQALQKNPLDARLPKLIAGAHTYNARAHAEAGRFDEARSEFQASLAMNPERRAGVLCKWAACEFKARDLARAEELLDQARADSGSHLATAYSMLIETIRLSLPGPLKNRFNKDFNAGLAETPTPAAAVALAETTLAYHLAGITYHGQKTHQKKVLDYLKKSAGLDYAESQLDAICAALVSLKSYRLALAFTTLGKRRFKKNPMFFVHAVENELSRQTRTGMYDAGRDLEKARTLAQELPPGREKDALLERIDEHARHLEVFNPYINMFGRSPFGGFDPFNGFAGDEDDDDDYA